MYFVRHGQSHFNAALEKHGRDPDIVDAGLTPRGFEQARQAAVQLVGKGVTTVVTSPYTRALQTAVTIAEALSVPVHVEPLAGERSLYSCDIGSSVTALRAAWAQLDFSALAVEPWWPDTGESQAALSRRAAAFREKWQPKLAKGDVALISHWYFLHALTGQGMENGEVLFKKIY